MAETLWSRRTRILRGPGGTRILLDRRALAVWLILTLAVVALAGVALTLGETDLSLAEVWAPLNGHADDGTTRIVVEWRLPRVVIAILGGAALALSGAIFQSMTRNPLGSPDIIGFSTGSYTGALVVSLMLGASTALIPVGAFVGGLVTAAAVYLLAYRRGEQGFRLIVVGIAVSAMLMALNAYLLASARLEEAMSVAVWGAGTLNGIRWPQVVPVAIALAAFVPVIIVFVRRLRMLELGDDQARMLGVAIEPTRIIYLVAGVGLVATITAVAGPITFVALAAPQIAKRIVGATGPNLTASALMGALLLLASDVIAQRIIAPAQYPAGVVTACLGGLYLVWLLTRREKGRA